MALKPAQRLIRFASRAGCSEGRNVCQLVHGGTRGDKEAKTPRASESVMPEVVVRTSRLCTRKGFPREAIFIASKLTFDGKPSARLALLHPGSAADHLPVAAPGRDS